MTVPSIPYLSFSKIEEKVQLFFKQYHPSNKIPIPVEDIIDLKLGIHIFPSYNLHKDFGLDGFLERDMGTIWVDRLQYEQIPTRFRFTLAHELGHCVLHKNFYTKLPFDSIPSYKTWHNKMPAKDIHRLEVQCDIFAGKLLVPVTCLEQMCKVTLRKYKNDIKNIENSNGIIWSYIAKEIAELFEVSHQVIEIRIDQEKIPERISW